MDNQTGYWEKRGRLSYNYKGETFYTITAIPYYYRRREILLSLIYPILNDSKIINICDFGCGDGWYIKHLSEKFMGKSWYGVDISNSMIFQAKKNCNKAILEVSNSGISFNVKFHLIYSIAVFAHVMDDEESLNLFKNISDKLDENGIFIIFEQVGPKKVKGSFGVEELQNNMYHLQRRMICIWLTITLSHFLCINTLKEK